MFSNDVSKIADPLPLQQLKHSLNLGPLLDYVGELFNLPVGPCETETDQDCKELKNLLKNPNRCIKRKKGASVTRVGFDSATKDAESKLIKDGSTNYDPSSSEDSEVDWEPVTEEEIQREMKHLYLRKRFKKQAQNLDDDNDHKVHKRSNIRASSNFSHKQKSKKILQSVTKRKKLWVAMTKKEVLKVHRSRSNRLKEVQSNHRKVAQSCLKFWRQKTAQSQKNMKEIIWRAKRLTKEMQTYWKRYDRVERETRRRLEKEAEEQRKLDVEFMEVKRQQRKLNFLITQTELYAYFMSKKLGHTSDEEHKRILNQLNEEKIAHLASLDDYDSDTVKRQIQRNVLIACEADKLRSSKFRKSAHIGYGSSVNEERPQPALFTGKLKHYQLKGMNWLANLYDQGINGILADEMGLGKTIQSIAFFCHIAEKYSIWGPFLVISPSSTLHNWQQEMARFSPDFKVVPYWGNPQERRILRQFWDLKGLHTRNASFHVVITSYQLIVTDFKYFNRIQWQYLILDEAQAIKSSNSMRWKMLLGFKCRNRLLLSGTPIQNSMAELWALLHFIMPSMFDSHDEFNEWFSKDIESHAENRGNIDEKHLTRLHSILKPFMLRRVKKDVENELSDKIEVMVYCPLTSRQRILYAGLKNKISIDDLLRTTGAYHSQMITSNLLNLVMQFRKVCNHPELFERREPVSPLLFKNQQPIIPILVFNDGVIEHSFPSKRHLLYNTFNIFSVEHIHRTLFPFKTKGNEILHLGWKNAFSFLRLIRLSAYQLNRISNGGVIHRWMDIMYQVRNRQVMKNRELWWATTDMKLILYNLGAVPNQFTFTSHRGDECVFSFGTEIHSCMPETMEHRLMRSLKLSAPSITFSDDKIIPEKSSKNIQMLPEFPHIVRQPLVFHCYPTYVPRFMYHLLTKVQINHMYPYCCSRRFAWYVMDHRNCSSNIGYKCVVYGDLTMAEMYRIRNYQFNTVEIGGLKKLYPIHGWSGIEIPDKLTLITDCGKLSVLDGLLKRLKEEGHRVLIYSQMTKMIDLLEEYMCFRKHRYMRLDGSSKISDRRDMVEDFQTRSEIFVFLLSTRAGGVGINLTAADTVIFYDSDWNPTVDQQAMDRTHRLGQTKQVTVYRLICKDTIEERILQRACEKSEIQRMVISGGTMKQDVLKPKEVVSILLDDKDIEKKYRQKQLELRRNLEDKQKGIASKDNETEKIKNPKQISSFTDMESESSIDDSLTDNLNLEEGYASSIHHEYINISAECIQDDDDDDDYMGNISKICSHNVSHGRGTGRKRGRPISRNRIEKVTSEHRTNVTHFRKHPTRRGRGRPRLFPHGGPSRREF